MMTFTYVCVSLGMSVHHMHARALRGQRRGQSTICVLTEGDDERQALQVYVVSTRTAT